MREIFPCLLRLDQRPTEYECESDCEDPHPFWILDCRFSIVGKRLRRKCVHRFVLPAFNPKSKIGNPKLLYDPVRPRQHSLRNRQADLLGRL